MALFLAVQVPVMLVLALLAALALDSARLRWAPLYRLSIFLPYAVPAVVAVADVGLHVRRRSSASIASIDSVLHVGTSRPASAAAGCSPSIGNIVTWEFVGYNMLIFYAALRVVPGELYEAAEIDGAAQLADRPVDQAAGAARRRSWSRLIFSIIGSFQLFNEPNILQPLAPDTISTYFTPNMYAYNLSFAGQEYNYSATIAIVMGILTMIIAYAVQLYAQQEGGMAMTERRRRPGAGAPGEPGGPRSARRRGSRSGARKRHSVSAQRGR